MSKHTPGPWKAIGCEVYEDLTGGDFICEIDRRTLDRPDTENVANARLIAAAPELLEALRALDAHFASSKEVNHGYACRADGEMHSLVRAAIAKAEGSR